MNVPRHAYVHHFIFPVQRLKGYGQAVDKRDLSHNRLYANADIVFRYISLFLLAMRYLIHRLLY